MIDDFIKDLENCLELDEGALQAGTRLEDVPNLDSLGTLTVMTMIHSRHGVVIKADELAQSGTVQDLFDRVSTAA